MKERSSWGVLSRLVQLGSMNHSPWIAQLDTDRIVSRIHEDTSADAAVVGAGIAGIATAFFILTRTEQSVVLVEASKVAHGATGHNAGQVTSYFERGFASMVAEFGLARARDGQKAVEDAWILLDELYTTIKTDIPFARFLGHAGLSTRDQVFTHLENNYQRVQAGLEPEQFLIADHVPFLGEIPSKYESLYQLVPHTTILERIESRNPLFIASISFQKGCVNSALLCEHAVRWMHEQYPQRFRCFEQTPIHKVVLHSDRVLLDAGTAVITASHVVLCTNGFDTITIFDTDGLAIDTKFRHSVSGVVGYMSAYLEQYPDTPMASSYLLPPNPDDPFYHADEATGDPYFLITRREYRHKEFMGETLVSVAGPEVAINERSTYSRDIEFPDAAATAIDAFVQGSYARDTVSPATYLFTWHGLMGYTPNGIRLIGPEPRNARLIYNLGCNGIGILPSVHGGHRIAQLLRGDILEPSIFDPQ